MSEQKRYTAEEIRKVADRPSYCGDDCEVHLQPELVPMLRQAADAEDELAQLKARLDAVVKVAEEQFDIIFHSPMCWDEDENESHSLEQSKEMDALEMVVATARGEGGAE